MQFAMRVSSLLLLATAAVPAHALKELIGYFPASSNISGSSHLANDAGFVADDSFGPVGGALTSGVGAASYGGAGYPRGQLVASSESRGLVALNFSTFNETAPAATFSASANWSGRFSNLSDKAQSFELQIFRNNATTASTDDPSFSDAAYFDSISHASYSINGQSFQLGSNVALGNVATVDLSLGELAPGQAVDLGLRLDFAGIRVSSSQASRLLASSTLAIGYDDGLATPPPTDPEFPIPTDPLPTDPVPTDPIPTAPVPEPATWVMMLAGLGLTGWVARRGRRQ